MFNLMRRVPDLFDSTAQKEEAVCGNEEAWRLALV